MQKNLKIFSSDVFGNLRTWDNNGKIMFVASDVAKMLGYARPADAVSAHCRCTVKHRIPHPLFINHTIKPLSIPERGYFMCCLSRAAWLLSWPC